MRESIIVKVSFGSCGHCVLSISAVNFIVGCSTCSLRCRREKFTFAISSADEFLVHNFTLSDSDSIPRRPRDAPPKSI